MFKVIETGKENLLNVIFYTMYSLYSAWEIRRVKFRYVQLKKIEITNSAYI